MKLLIYGATGAIGSHITREALDRGHQVTVVLRDPEHADVDARANVVRGDVLDPAAVRAAVPGHDAVVSAIGPRDGDYTLFARAARPLVEALRSSPGTRLVVLGGAGSLEAAPGVQVVDTPEFPDAWKGNALGQRDALDVYREADDVLWTYISPAAVIAPGERTGQYRVGGDKLLTDEKGESRISTEDYAVALIDELEHPQAVGRRITVAY
jgi:hypothetical protein